MLPLHGALCPHLRVLRRGLCGCVSPQPLQEQVGVSPQARLTPGLCMRVRRELFRAVLRAQVRCGAQGRAMASVPGSVLPSHPSYMTRDFSVPPGSLELLSSWAGRRRRPGGFGGCNSGGVSLPRMDQQCPKGWWGNPTCGPCNCDVNKGFDPDCNKTNGQCHCKVRGSCAHGDVAHGLPGSLLVLDAVPCPIQRPGSCPGPALCAHLWAGSLLSSSVGPSCPSMVMMGAVGVVANWESLVLLCLGSSGSPGASLGCCPYGLSDGCPRLPAGLPLPPQR